MTALTPASIPHRQVQKKAIPKVVCDIEGVAATANTAITGASSLTPTDTPCTWRVQVCLAAAAKFYALVTTGDTERTLKLNAGSDLAADCLYSFDLLVHAGDTVTFQSDTTTTLHNLRVQELIWGGN